MQPALTWLRRVSLWESRPVAFSWRAKSGRTAWERGVLNCWVRKCQEEGLSGLSVQCHFNQSAIVQLYHGTVSQCLHYFLYEVCYHKWNKVSPLNNVLPNVSTKHILLIQQCLTSWYNQTYPPCLNLCFPQIASFFSLTMFHPNIFNLSSIS